jgi:peptide/nickel transport system ATP-binding protein
MKRPLLDIERLSIGFGRPGGPTYPVVHEVSLTIRQGETLGIVGESGCGKSTLALALLGHLRQGSRLLGGSLRLAGEDLFRAPAETLRRLRGGRVALVPQNAGQALTPTLRIGAQIAEALAAHRSFAPREAEQEALALLAQVRLPNPAQLARRYPHQLSGGQQQRVAIAMALAGEPELLVLDEPTTGLDATTQRHTLELLDEIRRRTGAALVFVSHDLGLIAQVTTRIAVMYAGELVELGPTEHVFARPAHPYTRGLLASAPRLSQEGLPRALSGQPPAPGQVGPGCAFAPRCPYAEQRCIEHAPALEPADDRDGLRLARCHYLGHIASLELEQATSSPKPAQQGGPTLVELSDVELGYTRAGFGAYWQRLRGKPEPPPAVRDISLTLRRGETLALVGESGSGKSTLARAIAGLHRPRAGRIVMGTDDLTLPVGRRSAELRRAIQLVFQNPDASLNPRHSVGQILEWPLWLFFRLPKAERRRRATALLEQMRLGAHYLERFPGQLSGGEKQRVAIARAFAAEPELVLCDEVVSALDVSVQAAVLELLATLQAERGVTYLFIAHDLAVVRAFADRVAVLYQGQLCEVGSVEQVYSAPQHPYTARLLSALRDPLPVILEQGKDRQ